MQHTPDVRRQLPEKVLGDKRSCVGAACHLDRRVTRRLAVTEDNNPFACDFVQRAKLGSMNDAATGCKEAVETLELGDVRHVVHPARHDEVVEARDLLLAACGACLFDQSPRIRQDSSRSHVDHPSVVFPFRVHHLGPKPQPALAVETVEASILLEICLNVFSLWMQRVARRHAH